MGNIFFFKIQRPKEEMGAFDKDGRASKQRLGHKQLGWFRTFTKRFCLVRYERLDFVESKVFTRLSTNMNNTKDHEPLRASYVTKTKITRYFEFIVYPLTENLQKTQKSPTKSAVCTCDFVYINFHTCICIYESYMICEGAQSGGKASKSSCVICVPYNFLIVPS